MYDVAKSENATYAMPSGDSAAAALWCIFMGYSFQVPYLTLIVPIVMFARVYNQCHWIGDTVVGMIIGSLWGTLAVCFFTSIVPMSLYIRDWETSD